MSRYLSALTAATAVGLSLSACASSPAATSAAVTRSQAAQLLTHYQSVNNQANGTLDGDLLATVEGGDQLAMDRAEYLRRKKTKEKYDSFSYTEPAYYIPRQTGYPKWFAVTATTGRIRHALLFTQERSGAPWSLIADPFPFQAVSGVTLGKDGYATAVDPGDGGAGMAPAKVAEAHAATLTRGARGMAPGPYTNGAYDALVKARAALRRQGVTLTSAFAPDTQRVFALRTTDGGALVWYVLRQTEMYDLAKPGLIGSGGDLVGLLDERVRHRLSTVALTQYLAVVPPHGAPRVIGSYRKAIHAVAS